MHAFKHIVPVRTIGTRICLYLRTFLIPDTEGDRIHAVIFITEGEIRSSVLLASQLFYEKGKNKVKYG